MTDENNRTAYWETVQEMAASALDDYDPDYDTSDAIHELVDGSWWIIYTYNARRVLDHTDSPEAWRDCYGSLSELAAGKDDPDELWPIMAYFAMCQDVAEAAQELGDERAEAETA